MSNTHVRLCKYTECGLVILSKTSQRIIHFVDFNADVALSKNCILYFTKNNLI